MNWWIIVNERSGFTDVKECISGQSEGWIYNMVGLIEKHRLDVGAH